GSAAGWVREVSAANVCGSEVCAREDCSWEVCAREDCGWEVCAREDCGWEVCAREDCGWEVRSLRPCPFESSWGPAATSEMDARSGPMSSCYAVRLVARISSWRPL